MMTTMMTKVRRGEIRGVTNTSRDVDRLLRCLDECLDALDDKDKEIEALKAEITRLENTSSDPSWGFRSRSVPHRLTGGSKDG